MRNINEKTILKEIFLEQKIDRASLSRKTGLSGGTVTKIVSELIQKGLINVFAPQDILIGGEAIEFSDYFLEKAVNFAKENAFGNLGERVIFDVDAFVPEAWTLEGVYQVIQEELFDIKV
ncbi:winged helix-turn-helix domain-containing protein [Petrotoga sp. 9PWA.NaAc.5.4]|uniref:ROK family transcriptional regulator n=1 Tax=Petrotoga sp. 9PWA.NaAc.5.4 TaxID=1434328 RepID=UPI000CAB8C31|nr:winged helix-turn-helix domain-containing protein [Petrotoga sp. 9PWA.NaAc.5.4]PNR96831.1 hypothetical protein X924_02095 [Petrotoga sp. 9PWA.NaAc.5.4]